MATSIRELPELRVIIDDVVYTPHLAAPPDRPYPMVYFITISNEGTEAVTIKGRKWVVRDSNGETIAVEGDGVVGEFPRIEPGESFSYNSYHIIGSDSVAEGAFLGSMDNGEAVFTRIPKFEMRVPV
ncbi:MAG: ApaG domain-containing protein [Chthoniobacterales bacterium]